MKVIIEGCEAHFNGADEPSEASIEVVGPPDEDLENGFVLLVHPEVSLAVPREFLARALRAFEGT